MNYQLLIVLVGMLAYWINGVLSENQSSHSELQSNKESAFWFRVGSS
jgi:hypothetical protein